MSVQCSMVACTRTLTLTQLVLLITSPSGTYITGAQAAQPILLLRILPRLSALGGPGMGWMNPDLQASGVISNMPESGFLCFLPLVRAQFQFLVLLLFHLFCLYDIQTYKLRLSWDSANQEKCSSHLSLLPKNCKK